jgi:hypothetical protein
MSAPIHRAQLSQADSKEIDNPMQTGVVDELGSTQFVDVMKVEWESTLSSLQRWICELLIKNHQLRLALMEHGLRQPEGNRGRHI